MTSVRQKNNELFAIALALYTALLGNAAILFSLVYIFLALVQNFSIPNRAHFKTTSGQLGAVFIAYYGYFFAVSAVQSSNLEQGFVGTAPLLPFLFWGLVALFTPYRSHAAYLPRLAFHAVVGILIIFTVATLLHILDPYLYRPWRRVLRPTGYLVRLEMFAGNPLPFGTILLTMSLFLFIGWEARKRMFKIFAVATFILAAWIIGFWAQTRGSFLVLIVLLPLIAWKIQLGSFASRHGFKNRVAAVAAGAGIIVLVGFLVFQFSTRLDQRLAALFTGAAQDSSIMTRLDMFSAGLRAFFDHWLIGSGFVDLFSNSKPYLESQTRNWTHFHNGFINHAVAGGIFGLALFIAVISYPVFALSNPQFRQDRDVVFLCVSISAIAILSALSNVLLMNHILSFFFATLIFLTSRLATSRAISERASL